MLKWLSGEEGEPGSTGPGSPRAAAGGGDAAVEEVAERLTQTEQLVTQLKELIREKDAALRAKDDRLKVEKETCEAKLSKLRLQNKAKVTSLTSQLEGLKKQQGGQGTPTHSKKGSSEGGEQANRGKIVLLKKKVEELEQQLAQRDGELESKRKMVESQRQRGEEMDSMLAERDRKLAEKEAYIVHLQTALAGDRPVTPATQQKVAEDSGAMAELQLLVQSLTRKVGEAEERYSLLQEQTDGLRELLAAEKQQYGQKEAMYKQNIQTFKDIILQKDNQLTEVNQMHEQELFRLAAKSDASADLEQLLKALKQKLHEKEEVLLGKTQVIDVLQGEVDGRDQQMKELTERLRRLQVERESLESKMEAEKHVMRAQLRDLMEKQQAEVQRVTEQHQAQVNHIQHDLLGQLEELRKASSKEAPASGNTSADSASIQRIAELEAQAKHKTEEASRSEAKFLKMKAWSKSRIRQLEEELKKSQAGAAPPDLTPLRNRVTALEEEREENLWKVEQYEELKSKNEMLEAKLVVYEEQQRTLQADLEQFTKRAASQASESGSADDARSQVLEWQEMVAEAAGARDRAREEKAAMALRISHMEEEREALATRQQELEEELAQARGLGHHGAEKLAAPSQRSLQEDFEFDGQAPFQDPRGASESSTPMEGENMGGGLRSVVEELELERNQLQEQILGLEERCRDLEDRLQLQARIESLQHESEKLQSQLASVRSQQARDAEKHQLLVTSLNEQLKGLSDTQECLESSLIEKENTLAKTSEKLELINSLRESLSEKETQHKDVSEKLLHTELALENVSRTCSSSEKRCSELKTEVADLMQKLNVLKERTQKQEVAIETLQTELDQTNEELDKLNTAHLEERAQLIHDLQSREREIDSLKDILVEKDKEMLTLAGNMAEYAEQVTALKQEIKIKEENLVRVEHALSKAEREAVVIRDCQTSDQQTLNSKITELVGKLKDTEMDLDRVKEERDSKVAEVGNLKKRAKEDEQTIQDLRGDIQKHIVSHRNHLSECETHIVSLKEQLTSSTQRIQESEELVSQLQEKNTSNEKLQQRLRDEEETYEEERKSFKEEQNKLLAQVEKYKDEVQTLSRQSEEQLQREEHIREEIQEKLGTIASLKHQLKENGQQAEDERQKFNIELQVRDSQNQKLSSELQSKSENISKLKNVLKSLKNEKQQLQDNLTGLNQELELQKNSVKELNQKVSSALELSHGLESRIHSLTQENQRLELSLSEVTAEKDSVLFALEGLRKENEELTVRNNVLEQSTQSNSETLMARTNECRDLSQSLRESREHVAQLQEQVQSLRTSGERLQDVLWLLRGQGCSPKREEVTPPENLVSKLQAEAELLCEERSQLRQQVEAGARQCQKHKDQVNEANEALKALSEQLGVTKENAQRLEAESVSLNRRLQSVTEENRLLRSACESTEQELDQQRQLVSDLSQQLQAAAQQNSALALQVSSLTEDNRRLQEALAENSRSVWEITSERRSLQEKNTGLEIQISDNQKTIEGLMKKNEELAFAADEITKVLKEIQMSNSAGLLEKTSECANLSEMLRERDEQLQSLRAKVEGLQMDVRRLDASLREREQTVSEQSSQLEARQSRLLQLQDSVSGLQQQRAEELRRLSQMQGEVETLRHEGLEAATQMEQKDHVLREVTDELSTQTQAVTSLTESAAVMEAEISSLKAAVQKLTADGCQLMQETQQRTVEISDFKEANDQLKSELQKRVAELSRAQEEVSDLQAALCDRDSELRAARSEREADHLTMQTKDESLNQQRSLIQQLRRTVAELEDCVSELRDHVDTLTSEASTLKNTLEKKERSSLESESRSLAVVESLHAKEEECENLKEQMSRLEESVTKLSAALQAQGAEVEALKKALDEKESALLDKSRSLQALQRGADEASLFKSQFMESAELVSQLQSHVRLLSTESEETQSAFNNLQDKHAATLEELRDVKQTLSQRSDEASDLQKLLDASKHDRHTDQTTIEALRDELAAIGEKLKKTEELSSSLLKEKDEAFASHRASVSSLTVEIERLKSQHLHVAAQTNALTENLEQREMALHAINSQYSAQAERAAQLVSGMQRLEEQNRRLIHESSLSKEEHRERLGENTRLQQEVRRLLAEKAELEQRHRQVQTSQRELQAQMEQQSSGMNEITEKLVLETESLQAKVSAKDEEVSRLEESVRKIEQILQDSEKEWLSVLDREEQDRNLLVEQLRSVEHEMKSKDLKVLSLKQDLDSLHEKLAEASSAIRQGSDQLSAKELEASASRVQLENVLSSVREKEDENDAMQQTLKTVAVELHRLLTRTDSRDSDLPVWAPASSNISPTGLQDLMRQLQEAHESEVDALKGDLDQTLAQLQQMQISLAEAEKVKEAKEALHVELQAKDEQMSRMNVQISQQKELLAGLSQQLRDKDASVAQVMEAASNERMKHSEEKASLEQAHKTSTKQAQDVSQHLQDHLLLYHREIEAKDAEKLELMKKNDDLNMELANVSKEKDVMKKKLQAALILRKDLVKKVEEYENRQEESLKDQSQVLLLRDQLEEVRDRAQAAEKLHQAKVSLLEKNLSEKEGEIVEHNMQTERCVKETQTLQTRLSELVQTLQEKNWAIEQLRSASAETEERCERERKTLTQRLEELEACRDEPKQKSAGDVESELAQMKIEKAMLQKKAQAALLARKETMKRAQEHEKKMTQELAELKDDYKALLEQHCQQTNELNAVQLHLDENVRELEDRHRTCWSHMDELDTLRQLVEERDKTLQHLKMSLAEKESQCHSLPNLQAEIENVRCKIESASLELATKDEALSVAERRAETLKSKLQVVEKELEEANAELREKAEDIRRYQERIQAAELMHEQDQAELEAAVVPQKPSDLRAPQETPAETQPRLTDDVEALTEELEQAKLLCADREESLSLLRQEQEHAFSVIQGLRDEVATLNQQLKEAEKLNQQLQQKVSEAEAKLKAKEAELVVSQTRVAEKEELIAALELQLRQQVQIHESAVRKMTAETEELHRSHADGTKISDQDNQKKIALLTRKLQAALLSRKELKEEVERLSATHRDTEAECSALESAASRLKQQNMDLETRVSSLNERNDQLSTQVSDAVADNRSLSAACDSLKLTIVNITQQKQAFSCQLESLKDSQTEELSKWKSKHAELKQEYESLLQAYENVSSEMDKMRQLLEGAKRDRQEALRRIHKHEAEAKTLQSQARETEEEQERRRQKIEDLEEENRKLGNELAAEKQRLEAEIFQMRSTTEELRVKLAGLQTETSQLAGTLEEATCSLKRKDVELHTYTSSMQLKLDEALRLNNSLTVQMEAQKTELGAQLEINKLLQNEKKNLSETMESMMNDYEVELGKKDDAIKELESISTRHDQEAISLNEKVRILEDDKSLLQEELENVQEISDKVKNENEYLETVILKSSERIDELTESVGVLQSQNAQLSSQLADSKQMSDLVRQEKEEEQLKLVREFEEKLRAVQRGTEGSKNVKKELQELLREKHQEINQLQENCIKYQEVILDLESSLKSSQSACELLEKEQKKTSEKIRVLEARSKQVEAELVTHKDLLQEATERMEALQTERDRLAEETSQHRRRSEDQPRRAAETEMHSYMENQSALQQQIEELKLLKDKESENTEELKQQLDSRDLQIRTLRRAAQTSEAKLSALCSNPQGADATKLWNELYQRTLHEKDNQLLEQGFVIKRFLEDTRVKDKEVNELRVTKSRLERTLNEYSVAAAAQHRQLFVMSASNAELSESAELASLQLKELKLQVGRLEQDRSSLSRRLADRDEAASHMQLRLQQMEKIHADTDAQLLLLQSQRDKLQADVEKQEGISLQLKTLLQGKDAEISSLLSCRDGQMSGYLEQLQANHRSQVAVYEDRLTCSRYQREKADKESRVLDAKVKSLQAKVKKCVQDKEQMAAKMESFKNSMVSLQSERERLMSEYRILEAKSELGFKGKDGSADGEGGAAKGLKHEIRKLLHQMDDLNSENAMLRAQLVRYREDLNQVLSLKDNQLKVLLKKQQDVITTLEIQKAAAEKQHRESRMKLQKEEETSSLLSADISKLQTQVSHLSQKKERSSTSEGRVIADLQEAVAARAAECGDLQQKLASMRSLTDELKEKIQLLERDTDKKLHEAEHEHKRELDAFEREAELMRSERETADHRVAQLAKDLVEMEQQLSEARTQSKELRARNESLCNAMAALQNDRDQLVQDFKVLRNRYDEELRQTQAAFSRAERSLQDASSDLAAFSKERDLLVHKLKAVESKDVPPELNKLVDELSKALSAKEKELKQVGLENDAYSRQLAAFSRSMASLQNDHDRLLDELVQARRAVEAGPAPGPEPVASTAGPKMEVLQQTAQSVPPAEGTLRRSDGERKDTSRVQQEGVAPGGRPDAERLQLRAEIQQLNTELQLAVEEKGAAAAQLRAVSQTLRDTQDRCQWLEGQVQGHAQGAVCAEVAPGAPQERSSEAAGAGQLRDRLHEMELSLADERARRESAEEALRLSEDRAKSLSRDSQRDFSIDMEAEEEWEAVSLNPSQPLITRKVKGGMVACRRWLRGRSLYLSRLLTGRARSRRFFLAYLLVLHLLVLMCLSGVL